MFFAIEAIASLIVAIATAYPRRRQPAIHSHAQSLRFQLEGAGVEVIELMPPAVKTDMTADMSEGEGVKIISTDGLVKIS
jgi:short-subunit dehydrogenase involved in D-alanine esterification of teichoic acids